MQPFKNTIAGRKSLPLDFWSLGWKIVKFAWRPWSVVGSRLCFEKNDGKCWKFWVLREKTKNKTFFSVGGWALMQLLNLDQFFLLSSVLLLRLNTKSTELWGYFWTDQQHTLQKISPHKFKSRSPRNFFLDFLTSSIQVLININHQQLSKTTLEIIFDSLFFAYEKESVETVLLFVLASSLFHLVLIKFWKLDTNTWRSCCSPATKNGKRQRFVVGPQPN